MPSSVARSHQPPITVVLGLVALFGIGIGTLVLISFVKFKGSEIVWDFLRELGIALVVSGVVASLFELYRSIRHHIQTMRDVIDLTLGEQITPEVWLELKNLIEARKVIRRNVQIRWSLARIAEGSTHATLGVELEYELHALSSKTSKFEVEHELDFHMRRDDLHLPRFERIVVDPPGEDASEVLFDKMTSEGKVSFQVNLGERGSDPIRIRVERFELVNVPGAYNLYTPEFAKGLEIHYGECPDDISPEVLVRPLGHGLILKHVGNHWSCEHLLLPGRGVEIKFHSKCGLQASTSKDLNTSLTDLAEATAETETASE